MSRIPELESYVFQLLYLTQAPTYGFTLTQMPKVRVYTSGQYDSLGVPNSDGHFNQNTEELVLRYPNATYTGITADELTALLSIAGHEFGHYVQWLREGDAFNENYLRGGYARWDNPYEQEAQRVRAQTDLRRPLADTQLAQRDLQIQGQAEEATERRVAAEAAAKRSQEEAEALRLKAMDASARAAQDLERLRNQAAEAQRIQQEEERRRLEAAMADAAATEAARKASEWAEWQKQQEAGRKASQEAYDAWQRQQEARRSQEEAVAGQAEVQRRVEEAQRAVAEAEQQRAQIQTDLEQARREEARYAPAGAPPTPTRGLLFE